MLNAVNVSYIVHFHHRHLTVLRDCKMQLSSLWVMRPLVAFVL